MTAHQSYTTIESLDVENDWPSDEPLDRIRAIGLDFEAASRFLAEDFERLAGELVHATVGREPDEYDPGWDLIHFSTGGWSGCESFIEAVLEVEAIRALHYEAWQRGGHYTFRVRRDG